MWSIITLFWSAKTNEKGKNYPLFLVILIKLKQENFKKEKGRKLWHKKIIIKKKEKQIK